MRHPWAVYSAGSKQMLRKAGCTYSTTKSCSLIAKLVKPSETIVKSNDSTKKKEETKGTPTNIRGRTSRTSRTRRTLERRLDRY